MFTIISFWSSFIYDLIFLIAPKKIGNVLFCEEKFYDDIRPRIEVVTLVEVQTEVVLSTTSFKVFKEVSLLDC